MRILILIATISIFISCKNSNSDNQVPSKNSREAIKKEIVGIWELLKVKYTPTREPVLVDANNKEYLEIKENGTCQDRRDESKWFLSYTEDFIFDSTSKIIFTEISNLNQHSLGYYDRSYKSYQIKTTTENNIKYLYLTSLQTSETRIYIRKN